MDIPVFKSLLALLRPGLTKQHTNFRPPIPAKVRLLVTLRYLALGDCFVSISQQFRIGLSTAREIVRETCQVIAKTMQPLYLRTPSTEQEWLDIADGFQNRWNFNHAIGCVDGKHIHIVQPYKSGSFYYNYKGYYSIVLMAVANADYEFLYVDVGSEGKASDGGIFQQCSFWEYMSSSDNPLNIPQPKVIHGVGQPIPFFLLADDAFRLGPNLLKPYLSAAGGVHHSEGYPWRLYHICPHS